MCARGIRSGAYGACGACGWCVVCIVLRAQRCAPMSFGKTCCGIVKVYSSYYSTTYNCKLAGVLLKGVDDAIRSKTSSVYLVPSDPDVLGPRQPGRLRRLFAR